MAILKALALGVIGAIAVPFVMRDEGGILGGWIADHTRKIDIGRADVPFSLVIFLWVTLFAWGFLKWADR